MQRVSRSGTISSVVDGDDWYASARRWAVAGDTHFPARSDALGCTLTGPHVRRRLNEDGALAKSRRERTIPVTNNVVEAYADYQFERDGIVPGMRSDSAFVNLFCLPLRQVMRYSTVQDLFDRLAGECGFPVAAKQPRARSRRCQPLTNILGGCSGRPDHRPNAAGNDAAAAASPSGATPPKSAR